MPRAHTVNVVTTFLCENGITAAPHPPYSPDLAPSDFYLFGRLKEKLDFMEFTSAQEIIDWITHQFFAINVSERFRAFLEWEARLQTYMKLQGDYFHKH